MITRPLSLGLVAVVTLTLAGALALAGLPPVAPVGAVETALAARVACNGDAIKKYRDDKKPEEVDAPGASKGFMLAERIDNADNTIQIWCLVGGGNSGH